MKIRENLTSFYNSEATKYYQTRKKYWAEGDIIIKVLENTPLDHIKILELGCGSGRAISWLNKKLKKKFSYLGVDIAENLLHYAKKDNPNQHFVCSDMLSFLQKSDQESVDIVLAFASFQHIASKQERIVIMKNIYRVLKYDGMVIFTNWALSSRFIKNYRKALIKSRLLQILSGGKKAGEMFLFHENQKREFIIDTIICFDEKSGKKIAKLSGFFVEKLAFLDQQGKITTDRRKANNTILVAQKTVFQNK